MSSETKVFLFWFALLVTCAAMIVGSELVGTRVRGAMLEVGQRGFILVLLACVGALSALWGRRRGSASPTEGPPAE